MCRKKKIKCDGKMPKCSHCLNYKTECVFTQVEKKRNPPKGYVSTVVPSRLRRLTRSLWYSTGPSISKAWRTDSGGWSLCCDCRDSCQRKTVGRQILGPWRNASPIGPCPLAPRPLRRARVDSPHRRPPLSPSRIQRPAIRPPEWNPSRAHTRLPRHPNRRGTRNRRWRGYRI